MLTQALIHSRNAVDYHHQPLTAGNTLVEFRVRAERKASTRAVSDWLAEIETDPAFAAEMAAARVDMAAAGGRPDMAGLRLRAGLSQVQLASAIGTTQANVSRIEAGRQSPSLGTFRAIALALGVGLDDLAEAIDGS